METRHSPHSHHSSNSPQSQRLVSPYSPPHTNKPTARLATRTDNLPANLNELRSTKEPDVTLSTKKGEVPLPSEPNVALLRSLKKLVFAPSNSPVIRARRESLMVEKEEKKRTHVAKLAYDVDVEVE